MKFATGYTLGLKDMFCNFNIKRLKLSAKTCEELIGNRHKERIVFKVFNYALKLIIDDIINKSITFKLPTGKQSSVIKMKRFEDDEFKKARRNGKWSDVDFLASNFSGNQMVFQYMSRGVWLEKLIYLDKSNKDLITKYTNEGKQYY